MKIFNLYEFNEEEYELFTKFSNEYWEEPWLVYVECCGGESWIAHQVINVLNLKSRLNQDVFLNVTKAYSNGFKLIMEFEGPINILEAAEGMWHQGTYSLNIRLDNKYLTEGLNNYSSMRKRMNKEELKKDLELARQVMTEEEVKMFLNGRDVFFTEKQLKSFLNKKKDLDRKK